MALQEKTEVSYEIEAPYNRIFIVTTTIIERDGVEITRDKHRRSVDSSCDISGESKELKDLAEVVWTDKVKQAWADFRASQEI
mgnify:CR=1 FL=1|tara:strand:- start:37 stop:285 length:249 start_codon:yes stop_codon:yes gene_type:complete